MIYELHAKQCQRRRDFSISLALSVTAFVFELLLCNAASAVPSHDTSISGAAALAQKSSSESGNIGNQNKLSERLIAYIKQSGKTCDPAKVDRLIADGANPNVVSPADDVSIVGLAASVNAGDCVSALLRRGVTFGLDSNSKTGIQGALIAAIADTRHCDPRIVSDLIAAGANANDRFISSKLQSFTLTPIYAAAISVANDSTAALKCARILLNSGADPNFQTGKGATPLMLAATTPSTPHTSGFPQLVELLLAKGAQPNVEYNDGKTALFLAFQYPGNGYERCLECAEMLLRADADIHHVDAGGDTPLLFVMGDHPTLGAVKLLVSNGANVNVRNSITMVTPLMLAARAGNMDIVKYLLSKGARCCAKDAEGRTVLDYVAQKDKKLYQLLEGSCGVRMS